MHPYKKQKSQRLIRAAIFACVISSTSLAVYAASGKHSWKKDMAMTGACALVVGAGLLKLKFDKNEKRFYNN